MNLKCAWKDSQALVVKYVSADALAYTLGKFIASYACYRQSANLVTRLLWGIHFGRYERKKSEIFSDSKNNSPLLTICLGHNNILYLLSSTYRLKWVEFTIINK